MLFKKKVAEMAIGNLENAGFLSRVTSSFERERWLRQALQGRPLQEDCGRVFSVDAEVLFESGPSKYLSNMSAFLSEIGAPVKDWRLYFVPGWETWFWLNGRRYLLSSVEDRKCSDYWTPAFLRFVEALNSEMRFSRVEERCYFSGMGNDALICFLTEPMAAALLLLNEAIPNSDRVCTPVNG